MKDFFGSLFGKGPKPRHEAKPAAPVRREAPGQEAGELFKKGDVIGGQYEVHGTLGKGGFGVVYLVYNYAMREVMALKTFRDEFLAHPHARDVFKKEALLWVGLEEHPFILAARWVDEVSGRLFVAMDYIAPDEQQRVSLADHLARATAPLGIDQSLRWAIQFCLGMEHAKARGLKCHRDIKPANILITPDGTLKISDFGLAAAAAAGWRRSKSQACFPVTSGKEGAPGFSLTEVGDKVRCGTPGYMAPEVYRCEAADARSDIYSFGLVLWQMATGSRVPPFVPPYRGDLDAYLRGIHEQQTTGHVPPVDGDLWPVIRRCLQPTPSERYGAFEEMRGDLEPILARKTGARVEVPRVGRKTATFWNNKGCALQSLGRYEEAIGCYDNALALDPRDAIALGNKGNALHSLGRYEEALGCYDMALAADPRRLQVWYNKGGALKALGRHAEAITCYDKVLAIDPRYSSALVNKGNAFGALGRYEDAVGCYNEALAIDPLRTSAWYNKATMLQALGRHQEAVACYDKVLAIDPGNAHAKHDRALSEEVLRSVQSRGAQAERPKSEHSFGDGDECDLCCGSVPSGDGYAVWSEAPDPTLMCPVGALLLCSECAGWLFSPENLWELVDEKRVRDTIDSYRLLVETGSEAMRKADPEAYEAWMRVGGMEFSKKTMHLLSAAYNAKRRGLSVSQARDEARRLAQLYWTDPDLAGRELQRLNGS